MLTSLKNLKPFQLAEYIVLILFAFCLPASWRIATYVMFALYVTTILRAVFEDGFKANVAQRKHMYVYLLFIAFWLVYALSFLYSDNSVEARIQIGKKLSFLLFPLYFLFSDLSYLDKSKVKGVMYAFVVGILMLYSVNLVWAVFDLVFNDAEISRLTSPHKFFKDDNIVFTNMHRCYFSLFTCLSLTFCVTEFITTSDKKTRIFNIIAGIILFFSPFFIYSRAGTLCTMIVLFVLWVWITFILKKKQTGLIIGVSVLISVVAGYFAFPKTIERFTNTIDNVKNDKGDYRIIIRKGNRDVIQENFLFGVGVGDRIDETVVSYREYKDELVPMIMDITPDDIQTSHNDSLLYNEKYVAEVYKYIDSIIDKGKYDSSDVRKYLYEYEFARGCAKGELNAHNQYNDTIIAVGIIGLLLLLSFFVIPIYLWIKNKSFDVVFFSFLVIIAFNSLFESVLERQMGIMFFTFFYFVLFHASFCQNISLENKN